MDILPSTYVRNISNGQVYKKTAIIYFLICLSLLFNFKENTDENSQNVIDYYIPIALTVLKIFIATKVLKYNSFKEFFYTFFGFDFSLYLISFFVTLVYICIMYLFGHDLNNLEDEYFGYFAILLELCLFTYFVRKIEL